MLNARMSKPGWRYDVKRQCMPTQSSKGQRIVSKRIKTRQETSRRDFLKAPEKLASTLRTLTNFLLKQLMTII